ncbi:MAG: NAD-dependent epimerase/dehydratase family protein [Candidatus Yanofskybacteria bacterium]|nr:NAD-dependent epimerase/dehydratase family protein [Candidatus Yanofskybacteria bacterium]
MTRNSQKIKVLVVGGAGYIGGAVTDILLAKKISFSVYDKLVYEHQYMKPVDFIYGDIRDYKRLKSAGCNCRRSRLPDRRVDDESG